MGWFGPSKAEKANERGDAALDAGDLDAAEKGFREAIEAKPGWSVPWFNLGLVHKRRRNWAELRRCCVEVGRLTKDEGALWNLGIAATALGDWETARSAWTEFGLTIPAGSGPIRMKLGPVPIRVAPDEHPEVVWCERIDPARGIVRNIPLPECGRRYGDLVLHDGAPNGTRMLGRQEVPVFDELALLEVSALHTFSVKAEAATEEDMKDLDALCGERGVGFEDWTQSVRMLCKECSEGNPDAPGHHHHHDEDAGWKAERRLAIAAATGDEVSAVLVTWTKMASGRAFSEIEELL